MVRERTYGYIIHKGKEIVLIEKSNGTIISIDSNRKVKHFRSCLLRFKRMIRVKLEIHDNILYKLNILK